MVARIHHGCGGAAVDAVRGVVCISGNLGSRAIDLFILFKSGGASAGRTGADFQRVLDLSAISNYEAQESAEFANRFTGQGGKPGFGSVQARGARSANRTVQPAFGRA